MLCSVVYYQKYLRDEYSIITYWQVSSVSKQKKDISLVPLDFIQSY